MTSPDSRPQTAPPRPAATVLLLREHRREVEVLVIRRHENLAFMGGQWVFPGGTVAAADTSVDALESIPEASRARCARFADLQGRALDVTQCLAFAVAAYRETFEETGMLLARCVDGSHCADDPLIRAREQRRAIVAQPQLFTDLLREQHLELRVDELVYWAHWITPSTVSRRFDTRFFLAAAPIGQTATIDTVEAVEHAWATPATLIAAAAAGAMRISQPTIYNLMELDASLREHRSLSTLLSAEAARSVTPVLPKILKEPALDGTNTVMVLPWDPDYRNVTGESAPEFIEHSHALKNLPPRMTQQR